MLQISNMVTEILTSEDTVESRRNLRLSRRIRMRQINDGVFSIETSAKLRTSLERCCYR